MVRSIANKGSLMNKKLTEAWEQRKKLIAEGKRLRAKGYKLYVEGHKLCAEGYKLIAESDKLYSESDKLCAEGDKLWEEAVIAVYGKSCKIECHGEKCILTPENRSITFE